MERSRRQPVVSSSKANARSALEALKAAREGGVKRAEAYECKEESALYDVVSEQDYATIAAKRRAEGGGAVCRGVVRGEGTGAFGLNWSMSAGSVQSGMHSAFASGQLRPPDPWLCKAYSPASAHVPRAEAPSGGLGGTTGDRGRRRGGS
eukprot:353830-Chlamydomonas_euryale.AAC.3